MEKKKLLIAEDDQFLREMYIDILSNEFEVTTAEDGEQALAKIKENTFDIVLMDMIMPKLNGLDVVKKVHGDTSIQKPELILFLTNLDKQEEKDEALKYGKGYLVKSQMDPGELVAKINSFISTSL